MGFCGMVYLKLQVRFLRQMTKLSISVDGHLTASNLRPPACMRGSRRDIFAKMFNKKAAQFRTFVQMQSGTTGQVRLH